MNRGYPRSAQNHKADGTSDGDKQRVPRDWRPLRDQYEARIKTMFEGRWESAFRMLASDLLGDAMQSPGKNVTCPIHHGKADFRLKKGWEQCGHGGCNSCGFRPNGVALLCWLFDKGGQEIAEMLGDMVGYPFLDFVREVDGRSAPKTGSGAMQMPGNFEAPAPDPRPESETVDLFDPRAKLVSEERGALKKLGELLRGGRPIDWDSDNPATRYFINRGLKQILKDPPNDLLLHPGIDFWQDMPVVRDGELALDADGRPIMQNRLLGTLPVLIGVIRRHDGEIVSAHRTWITEDGNKPFQDLAQKFDMKISTRRLMPSAGRVTAAGGAIRLYPTDGRLGTGEGIETVLAARILMNQRQGGRPIPVWAGVNTAILSGMRVPESVFELTVFADHDKPKERGPDAGLGAGEIAARKFREKHLSQCGVRIFLPARVKTDWNDVLEGFDAHRARTASRFEPARADDEQWKQYLETPPKPSGVQTPPEPTPVSPIEAVRSPESKTENVPSEALSSPQVTKNASIDMDSRSGTPNDAEMHTASGSEADTYTAGAPEGADEGTPMGMDDLPPMPEDASAYGLLPPASGDEDELYAVPEVAVSDPLERNSLPAEVAIEAPCQDDEVSDASLETPTSDLPPQAIASQVGARLGPAWEPTGRLTRGKPHIRMRCLTESVAPPVAPMRIPEGPLFEI